MFPTDDRDIRPVLKATFQPQEWINDHAVDSAPVITFDAFQSLLNLSYAELQRVVHEILADTTGKDLDCLAEAGGSLEGDGLIVPGTTYVHKGPFVVSVDAHDLQNVFAHLNLPLDPLVAEDRWDLMVRRRYQLPAASTKLCEGRISDWRLSDDPNGDHSGELSEEMKQPWKFEISRSGYEGLDLLFTAPDGTERSVLIEIDRGGLKLSTFRDPELTDSADAHIRIDEDQTSLITTGLRSPDGTRLKESYLAVTQDGFEARSGSPAKAPSNETPKP